MKRTLSFIIVLLLLFNGTGALYGGWNLMRHPDGSSIDLSLIWLKHTPFTDYFIPGIVLFMANGLSSFFVLITLVAQIRLYPKFVITQGVILTGWILIQIFLIRTFHFFHLVLGLVGISLIILGYLLPVDKDQHQL